MEVTRILIDAAADFTSRTTYVSWRSCIWCCCTLRTEQCVCRHLCTIIGSCLAMLKDAFV